MAQLGASVIVVEKESMGGECLNWGCIPSKALIEVANTYHRLEWLRGLGLELRGSRLDLRTVIDWKDGVIRRLRKGIEYLLSFYGASFIYGTAKLLERGVEVVSGSSSQVLEADRVVIATGAEPVSLPQVPFDGRRVIGFKEALSLEEVPSKLLVVGGGAVGLELGTAYRKLGSDVTVVEIMENVLPGMDKELSNVVARRLKELGIRLFLRSSVEASHVNGEGVEVTIKTPSGEVKETFDYVLVSVGKRAAEVEGVNVLGIERDGKGFVKVDSRMRTSNELFYAAGDVTGPPFLAHRAYRQGTVAAEAIMGLPTTYEPRAVPLAVFTDPEVASVGMTEEEARRKGIDVAVGRFAFHSLGRALITGDAEGFVKVVFDKVSGRILGVQIAGNHASELIGEASLLLELGATLEEADVMRPHPTFSEAITEAVEDALGRPLHKAKRLDKS